MARILVVDDQPQILTMIESLLVAGGHVVTTADNAYDGLDKVKNYTFEMVITDAVMPGTINGYDFVRTLRADVATRDLLIILLTGKREKKDVERGITSGVDDYCVKPVDPDLFLAKVDALLKSKFKGDEASFPEGSVSEPGQFHNELRITGISEVTMSFQSAQPFKIGAKVKIDAELFSKVGIECPFLRVMSCEPYEGQFKVRVQFLGMSEKQLQPLRVWIRSRTFSRAG